MGLWVFQTTVYWYAISQTGSSAAVAGLAIAIQVPELALAFLVGILSDRLGARLLLIVAQGIPATAATIAALACALGAFHYPFAFVASLLVGMAYPLWLIPSQSLISSSVAEPLVASALGVGVFQYALGRIAGASVAGLAMLAGGIPFAFALSAVLFVTGAGLTTGLAWRHSSSRLAPAVESAHVWRALKTSPLLPRLLAVASLSTITSYAYIPMLPGIARNVGSGSSGLTVLTAIGGCGLLAGGLAMPIVVRRFGIMRMVTASALTAAFATLALGIAPSLSAGAACVFCVASSGAIRSTGSYYLLQRETRPADYSRLLALLEFLSVLFYLVGAAAVGLIADRSSPHVALIAAGAAGVLGLLALLWSFSSGDRRSVAPEQLPECLG